MGSDKKILVDAGLLTEAYIGIGQLAITYAKKSIINYTRNDTLEILKNHMPDFFYGLKKLIEDNGLVDEKGNPIEQERGTK